MSLPTNIPSLPYLTRPRHKHSSSITLINTPSTPKEFTSFSPISRLLDSPKQIALPKVTRASFFSKSNLPSPTGQETRSRSRGFMGTTLQEIAPDEVGMQKDSPKRRTVKFEVVQDLGQPPVDNQKREDCNERLRTICACLAEIGEIRRSRMKEDNPYFRKDSEKLAKLIEEAFLAMGIQLKEMRNSIVDSAMLIEPIEEEQDLSSFYYMLIQEISEFPYTCLSKLKIRMISVCNDIDLCSPSYTQIMKQKINNGLFVLRQLPNREAIREHWYKVVLYHLVKAQPRFFMKWKETFGMFISKKGEADELLQALKCLLRPDKSSKLGLFQAEEKIKFLKNELEKFEPMMFDEEWCIFKKKEQIF